MAHLILRNMVTDFYEAGPLIDSAQAYGISVIITDTHLDERLIANLTAPSVVALINFYQDTNFDIEPAELLDIISRAEIHA